MARIIYGVSGQGFGHAMRSKVVLDYLIKQGHQVEVLAYGQSYDFLKDFFTCHSIFGLRLVYKENKVDYWATMLHDTKRFPDAVRSFNAVRDLYKTFDPELVISDYEPMSVVVARLKKLPVISIGNHHFITNTEIEYPKKYRKDYLAVKVVNDAMTPFADAYLVTTIAEEKIKDDKTFLFPPLLPRQVHEQKVTTGRNVLVYVTSKFEGLLDALAAVPNQKFVVYGFDRDAVEGNLIFKTFSREGFLADLAASRAVIANAGFTVISESLHFAKPYFAIPVHKQFEQIINAIYVKKMGYGDFAMVLTAQNVKEFLGQLRSYRDALKSYERSDNQALFTKLDSLIQTLLKK